jgi:hypothetical protein
MALQDSGMLVSLTITQWAARKLDKTTSFEVCKAKSADQNAGSFHKQIIPKGYLKNINQLVNRIRNFHYANTLAWTHKGSDLLPSRNYMKYVKTMGKLQDKFNEAVNDFLDHYDTVVKQAVNSLHGLYEESDYPTAEMIRRKFKMEINMTPIPSSGDFRIDINEKELSKLRDKLEHQLAEAQVAAEQDLFSRLYTAIAKATITLRTPGKIFRNTLILNIEELCTMIPDMNINNNKQLNDIADRNLKLMQSTDMKALRNQEDTDYRFDLADKLASELEIIEAVYMGATNDTIDTATNDDTSEESFTH